MSYTNSSLVTYRKISPHKTIQRNHAIDTITIHCIVGQWTAKQGCDYFATATAKCSANYVVGKDGSIGLSVEEKDRSWCSSNSSNDNRAITIEVASDLTHPYAVTDKALAALIELVADICKRNNIKELKWKADKSLIGQVDKQNMTVHRWFDNKSCPGEYLYNKHSYIASEVNKRLGATTQTSKPAAPTVTNLKFEKGDIVSFAGGRHYSSANAVNGSVVKASKAKITSKYPTGKHPYHIRAVNDNGTYISGVYGWVDASDISAIKTESVAPMPPSNDKNNQIDSGEKLTLKNVPIYVSSTSSSKASSITGTYYVWSTEVINNRIRITTNTAYVGKANRVTGWINYNDALSAVGLNSPVNVFTPYKIQITVNELNIRKGAGTNYAVAGSIKDKKIYTIVKEANGNGATKWGLLKSKVGWISLDYVKKV